MQYKCNCGSKSKITWNNFQQGQRCRKCSYQKTAQARRIKVTDIEPLFLERGCKLLNFINASNLSYKCFCGAIIPRTTLSSFKKGHGCRSCKITKISGPNNYQWVVDRKELATNKHFRKECYSLVRNTLNAIGVRKDTATYKLLGYSASELKKHILTHPNWTQIDGPWDLDHVFPIKAFLDYGISDIRLINCLENLQPLAYQQNRSKKCKYDRRAFESWLKKHRFHQSGVALM